MTSQAITALGTSIINLINRKTPIATASTVGMVKPDGSTIKIDANGVISSNGGSGSGSGLENKITNCLLEVPQRIKLELNDGTFTLKAGSVVIVPNGFETDGTTPKFDYVTIGSDISSGLKGNGVTYPIYNPATSSFRDHIGQWESGATRPSGTYIVWYDTASNIVRYTNDGWVTEITGLSLPTSKCTCTSSGYTSINQVFNGMGYIGSTVWVDKGVKGLIPNGRNEDGSLRNIEFTINKIVSNTLTYGAQDYYLSLDEYGTPLFTAKNVTKYDSDKNVIIDTYANIDRLWCFVGECTADVNNKITSFSIKQPFRAVDYNDIELNNPFSLFDSKYSDHELNNLSWLKSEGQWNSGTVYVDAYNELLREYNDSTSVEKTEGSITFKRTPNGYKIADSSQEEAILNKYNTDGIAWYYILDKENVQFKLPRTKFGFEGLRTNAGDDIKESLPNISGYFNVATCDQDAASAGAFTINNTWINGQNYWTGTANKKNAQYLFNASKSSSTYKNGAPVQERATQMYLYFYVGETVQNANLIDAGRIGEQLTNKADIDLNNLSSTGVEKFDSPWVSCNEYQIFSNVGLSSSTYSEYTLDFLPDNGVFELNCMYTANAGANNGYVRLVLNDESESYRFVVGANTGTASNPFIYGQVNLIISNKKVKAMKVGGGNGNEKFSLTAVAYRKLGTGFAAI